MSLPFYADFNIMVNSFNKSINLSHIINFIINSLSTSTYKLIKDMWGIIYVFDGATIKGVAIASK